MILKHLLFFSNKQSKTNVITAIKLVLFGSTHIIQAYSLDMYCIVELNGTSIIYNNNNNTLYLLWVYTYYRLIWPVMSPRTYLPQGPHLLLM